MLSSVFFCDNTQRVVRLVWHISYMVKGYTDGNLCITSFNMFYSIENIQFTYCSTLYEKAFVYSSLSILLIKDYHPCITIVVLYHI